MSVNKHPTKGNGWWQIRFRPNGCKGKQKVVTFKGTRAEALEKESTFRALKIYAFEAEGKNNLSAIDVDIGGGPYVYFIQQGARGPIKIGFSANPVYRLRELQSCNPFELKVVGLISAGTPQIEVDMHNMFNHIRLCGEWFEPRDELIIFIKTYCRNDANSRLKIFAAMVRNLIYGEHGKTVDDLVQIIQKISSENLT